MLRPPSSIFNPSATKKRKIYNKKKSYSKAGQNVTYPKPRGHLTYVNTGKTFPDKLVQTLKYFDTVQFTAVAGAPANYVFRLNGLKYPDYTGNVDHYPSYFNVASSIYDHYVVLNARATVSYNANYTTTGQGPFFCAQYISDVSSTPAGGLYEAAEQATGQFGHVGFNCQGPKLVSNYNAAKFWGGPVENNANQQGACAASGAVTNPTEGTFLQIVIQPANYTSTATYDIFVYIEYQVMFQEVAQRTYDT